MAPEENWMERARCARFPELGWIKDRDQVGIGETATMAVVCGRCPAFDACEEFVAREEITSGFWAGQHRDLDDARVGGAA